MKNVLNFFDRLQCSVPDWEQPKNKTLPEGTVKLNGFAVFINKEESVIKKSEEKKTYNVCDMLDLKW